MGAIRRPPFTHKLHVGSEALPIRIDQKEPIASVMRGAKHNLSTLSVLNLNEQPHRRRLLPEPHANDHPLGLHLMFLLGEDVL